MTSRVATAVGLALTGFTAWHAVVRLRQRNAESPAHTSPVRAVGLRLQTQAWATGRMPAALGATGGRCAYLVLTEPSCGASAAEAAKWMKMVAQDSAAYAVPPGWSVAWVSTDDSATTAGLLPSHFPFSQLFTKRGELIRETGVRFFPTRLILDRTGAVVFEDVGAPMPRRSQYRQDCTIDRSETVAVTGVPK
jgi:hypothetical protein